MTKEARHHHYLSQCYLRGFTKSGGKKSKLSVIDIRNKKHFETSTRNVGGIRDFNRIEIEGLPPDAIETDLSHFEGMVATSIRNVEIQKLFAGEDKENILNLIALLGIRSPEMRENWRQFNEKICKKMMSLSLATEERWDSQTARMKEKGYTDEPKVSYEEIKAFHASDEYTVELKNEAHIQMELTGIEAILPTLFDRKWVLILATDETGPFITTDNPVILTWNNPDSIPPLYRKSPGHGMRDTQILFPLSRNMTLLGEFDGNEGVLEGSVELIASLNSKMLSFTYKKIYAPKMNFNFYNKANEIINGTKLLSLYNA